MSKSNWLSPRQSNARRLPSSPSFHFVSLRATLSLRQIMRNAELESRSELRLRKIKRGKNSADS
jgi:hypothetical protein